MAEVEVKTQPTKMKPLNYLSFLKFVAMSLIIMWHVVAVGGPVDFGGRMCEFLIVASGFLVGYNHYRKPIPCTVKDSVKYGYKRFRTFYPLHIIALVLYVLIRIDMYIEIFNITRLEQLFANIFLVQAWSPYSDTVFSYNGLSWFLSAILFCYLLSPLFLKGIKNLKTSLILFFIVLVIRFSIEGFVSVGAANIFEIWFHANPVTHAMNFFLGLLIVPTYYLVKEKLDKFENATWFKIIILIVQLGVPTGLYFFLRACPNLMRATYVLVFCVFTFIVSFDYGYLSKLFSFKPLKRLFSYQMEMYLLQQVVNFAIINLIMKPTGWNFPESIFLTFLIKYAAIIVFAALYHEFLYKRAAILLDKIVYSTKNLIQKVCA